MSIVLILRLAGWAAAAAAVMFSVVTISRRNSAVRRGRAEPPDAVLLTPAEADARCRSVMERDGAAALAHRLTVVGLMAGVMGHAFSPLREVPGFAGTVSVVVAGVAFLGGAALLTAGSLIPMARRLAGRTGRFTRLASDLAPLAAQILVAASGAFYFMASLTPSEELRTACSIFHDFSMASFLAVFTSTKLYHVIGFLTLKKAGIPRLTGVLPRDPGVDALRASEEPESVRIGLSGIEDLSSRQRAETLACVSCGLCDAACPAARSGKGLSPMRLTLARASETEACTACYACETACPLSIRKVERVVAVRRHALLEGGSASPAQARALRNIERTGNLLGMDPGVRLRLLEEAGVPILDGERPDYVLWLGCQAAGDPRMRSVVKALAGLLKASGRKVAAFETESCCGDLARRIGEENLFLDLVQANAAMFSRLEGVPIVTACPHCAVSIGREYPALGVDVKAVHYTEILGKLGAGGPDVPAAAGPFRVAYHDSCLVSRVLGVVEEPRAFLRRVRPDAELVALSEEGVGTLCCGGGGGRILAEEAPGERIAVRTVEEAAAKGADALLVSCPNCLAMFTDAAALRAPGLRVMDLAELAGAAVRPHTPFAAAARL